MPMCNPPHPAEIAKWECIDPLGLCVTKASKGLGMAHQALSELINGKSGIFVEMLIRLSKAFSSIPETWRGIPMDYDLWQAQERGEH